MNGLFRYTLAVVLAVFVTLAAFFVMHHLIADPSGQPQDLNPVSGIRFEAVEIEPPDLTPKRERPERTPPPDAPPPPPDLVQVSGLDPDRERVQKLDWSKAEFGVSRGPTFGPGKPDQAAEGDVVPLVRVNPQYPQDALRDQIEGYVTIQFTITETGMVRDPRVIDAQPARIFNKEAIRAIQRWKFKPRIVGGVAVSRAATQTLVFQLDGEN
ncbi:MAG: energy transducer TonB [Wenzhouxiangellaceae bacterium]